MAALPPENVRKRRHLPLCPRRGQTHSLSPGFAIFPNSHPLFPSSLYGGSDSLFVLNIVPQLYRCTVAREEGYLKLHCV